LGGLLLKEQFGIEPLGWNRLGVTKFFLLGLKSVPLNSALSVCEDAYSTKVALEQDELPSSVKLDFRARLDSDVIAKFCSPSQWNELCKETSSKILPCGDEILEVLFGSSDRSPWNEHPFCTNRMVSDQRGTTLFPTGSSMLGGLLLKEQFGIEPLGWNRLGVTKFFLLGLKSVPLNSALSVREDAYSTKVVLEQDELPSSVKLDFRARLDSGRMYL
nr:hypothetical protein [Tanacetum cinerariifolium]